VKAEELPPSLFVLDLRNNPCTTLPDYDQRVLDRLPRLRILDNCDIVEQEGEYVIC
jgi:hypothetical protein